MKLPSWPEAGPRERELLEEVLDSPQWGGFHPIVERFETSFAAYQDCRHGIAVANGTLTLEAMLAAVGIGPGDEVIVPAISFVSTATAVSRVGATPVFVDIEELSFNLDPERARAAVGPRTKALLVTHFGGPLADMDRLLEWTRERGVLLLEDAAHAHGSEWRGRRAGSFGLCASFSFQNGKVMTAGEGGIITTNDDALAERLRSLVNQGRRKGHSFFHHFDLASNLRMTGLQAAVLVAQLERLDDQTARRARNAQLLCEALERTAGMRLQSMPRELTRNSWYLFLGRIDAAEFGCTRDEFHQRLTAAGVPCTPFYPHPLYGNPLYLNGGCRVEPCPVAEACIHDAFWLPHRVLLADDSAMAEVADLLRAAAHGPLHAGLRH